MNIRNKGVRKESIPNCRCELITLAEQSRINRVVKFIGSNIALALRSGKCEVFVLIESDSLANEYRVRICLVVDVMEKAGIEDK